MNVEPLVATPEVVEVSAGDALAARSRSLGRFAALGPPDLVVVRRRWTPSLPLGRPGNASAYHFVRGLDVSSAASVAAYLISLKKETPPWYSSGVWDIYSAQCSAYSAFSNVDVVVTAAIPGGVTVRLLREGDPLDTADDSTPNPGPDDILWQELFVSAIARDIASAGENPTYPCLKTLPCLQTRDDESRFLDAAAELAPRWYLTGSAAPGFEHQPTNFTSRIAVAVVLYFTRYARYEAGADFFLRMVAEKHDQKECGHLCAALVWYKAGEMEEAQSILDALVAEFPGSSSAWELLAQIHMDQDHIEKARRSAEAAVTAKSDNVSAWTIMAKLYIKLQKNELAFLALNSIDMPPPQLDPFLRELIPGRRKVTTPVPTSDGSSVVAVMARRLREERTGPPSGADATLADLPSRLMTDPEKEAYAALCSILDVKGWDDLLAIRGACFVMEVDIANASKAQTPVLVDDVDNAMGLRQQSTKVVEVDGIETELTTTKKLCKPWLDFLVTNMYEDLRAIAVWQAEDQIIRGNGEPPGPEPPQGDIEEGVGPTQAGIAPVRTSAEIAAATSRPSVDWLRRGELGRRLGKPDEAKLAFLVAIKVAEQESDVCISSWMALLGMYAEEGNVLRVMVSADAIWTYLNRMSDVESPNPTPVVPIRSSLAQLLSKAGLAAVREELAKIKADLNKERLNRVLDDLVDWGARGHDR